MLTGIDSVFAHVDMDAFFVSVELARRPGLKGKAVAVGGGRGSRMGVVAAASYEARNLGVCSGMPVILAKRRCPDLVMIRPDMCLYESVSRKVMSILRMVTPDLQVLSVDEALLDLSGVLRLWGEPMRIADKIHGWIRRELGVPCSIGIARFPLVAKLASKLAKQNGICMISPGEETAFLRGRKISAMPGIGRKTAAYLNYLGIFTMGDLSSRLPLFWERLLLTRPVPNPFPKSVSSERTLDRDAMNRHEVLPVLRELCRKIAFKLRRRGLGAGGVSVRIRYGDFQTVEQHRTRLELRYDVDIIRYAEELFAIADCLPLPIRQVGVRLAPLFAVGEEGRCFSDPSGVSVSAIYRVVDTIREKYGRGVLVQGR